MYTTVSGKNVQVADLMDFYEKLPVGIIFLNGICEGVSGIPDFFGSGKSLKFSV
ncbi:hypothetical protein [Marinilabilia sp.]|uniref:hypothetical protein n=1 Tax=Marinilabilia sp. TaxID=2021252 RepID=UPI0025C5D18E|nr:hypothetical protein [Marinilabilia sp.]